MCRVSCRHLFGGGGELPLPSQKILFFPSFLLLFLNAHLLICLLEGINTVAQYPLLKGPPPQKKVSPPKLRFVFHNIYQSCVTRRSAHWKLVFTQWDIPLGIQYLTSLTLTLLRSTKPQQYNIHLATTYFSLLRGIFHPNSPGHVLVNM